jgi:hypothetical protein
LRFHIDPIHYHQTFISPELLNRFAQGREKCLVTTTPKFFYGLVVSLLSLSMWDAQHLMALLELLRETIAFSLEGKQSFLATFFSSAQGTQ